MKLNTTNHYEPHITTPAEVIDLIDTLEKVKEGIVFPPESYWKSNLSDVFHLLEKITEHLVERSHYYGE